MNECKKILLTVFFVFLTSCTIHTGSKVTIKDYPSETAQITPAGSYTKEELNKCVSKRMKDIARCYEKALAYNKKLYGKIIVQWDVLPDGKVTGTLIKERKLVDSVGRDSESKKYLENCVIGEVLKIKLPSKNRSYNSTIVYPFVFVLDNKLL